jgi:hypothetical protein
MAPLSLTTPHPAPMTTPDAWSRLVETMGFEPTTRCLQTVWTKGLGELSWAPTRTERPGATSMVRVVWHVRGTAEHGITSLFYGERTYEDGR